MPSRSVHAKWAKELGIPRYIAEKVDKYIDSRKHHDFWNKYVSKEESRFRNEIRELVNVNYMFKGVEFRESNHCKHIFDNFGELGLKVFFLHVVLDIIERIIWAGSRSWVWRYKVYEISFCDKDGVFDKVFREVVVFVCGNQTAILKDIIEEVVEKTREDVWGKVDIRRITYLASP